MKFAVLTAAFLLIAGTAQADLTVCNRSGSAHTVAVAYHDGSEWVSEGWWAMDPGACKLVLSGKLAQRHYYYTVSGEPDFAGEGYAFCTTEKPFTLKGADGDCASLGGKQQPFGHIDTGLTAENFTFDLTDPAAPVIKSETEAPLIGAPDQAADMVADTGAADGAAFVDSFEPGQQGEPFTVTALIQGCGETEELNGCTFYAEGARWVAARGAGSNEAALDAMAAMPVNTAVIVSGDMLSFGDITAEALISRIELTEPDAYAAMRAAMQGKWVSQDDPQSTLEFTGSEVTDGYGGETMAVSVATYADACPGGDPIGPVMFKQEMGGDPMDLPCFALVDVTPDRMELSYVGRGNTLVYVRP